MEIVKAVKEAVEQGRYISSHSFPELKIKPTNSPSNCILMNADGSNPSRHGWQPSADDLMRNDWIVTD